MVWLVLSVVGIYGHAHAPPHSITALERVELVQENGILLYIFISSRFFLCFLFRQSCNKILLTTTGFKFRYTKVRREGNHDVVEKQREPYHSNAKVRMDNHPLIIMAEQV